MEFADAWTKTVTSFSNTIILTALIVISQELIVDELSEISDYLHGCASKNALIISGIALDDTLNEDLNITLIAAGFDAGSIHFFTEQDKFGNMN